VDQQQRKINLKQINEKEIISIYEFIQYTIEILVKK